MALGLAGVFLFVIIISIALNAGKTSSEPEETAAPVVTQVPAAAEEKVYTPTFVYIVTPEDSSYEASMLIVKELQEEYGDRVNFDIRNAAEDPSQLEAFNITGKTPALFMLDTSNNICAMLLQNSDKADLKTAIEKALGN